MTFVGDTKGLRHLLTLAIAHPLGRKSGEDMAELRSPASENGSTLAYYLSRWPWQEMAVFVVIATTILLANWPLIDMVHFEVGDFAANGLLIQKAKVLDLWVGNYSRIGVNHPGPAILYVLAFGELVLFDWMNVVPSPFSGQMVAAILYNAFWITLAFSMLKRLSGSISFAGIATAIFLSVIACVHFQFFAGMWFPELYFFPFAAMLIAAARFASGRADMLLSLALSSGFLINGHVSFVSTLGILFFLSLAYNRAVYRAGRGAQSMFGRTYWQENGGKVIRSAILLFLFFIPLLVETIRHFPGPVATYIRFGHSHQANTLGQAARYTGHYWGGGWWFVAGLLLMVAVFFYAAGRKKDLFYENIRAVIALLISATLAMLFYSKFGVDFLDMDYMGYFYYSVPALAVGVAAGCLWSSFGLKQQWLVVVLVLVLLGVAYRKIDAKPAYVNQYSQPNVVDLYDVFLKNKSDGRLVLELDNRSNYEYLWASMLGAEMYAVRRGVDLFCVDKGWANSFTVEAQCTLSELTHNKKIIVSASPLDNKLALLGQPASLFLYGRPDGFSGNENFSVKTDPNLFGYFLLGSGWSHVESEFVWMESQEAHLRFKIKEDFTGSLQLDLSAFLPHPDSVQRASIYINDKLVSEIRFDAAKNQQTVAVPLRDLGGSEVDVKFVDHDVASPKAAGESDDPRTLGVALRGFALAANSP
jgi:hypothetical protein